MAWSSNSDNFILLGLAWTQHPISYFLSGLQFPQPGSQFTANASEWRQCRPRVPNQWERARDLEKTGMRVIPTPTRSQGLRVKPFHSINVSVHRKSRFKLSCMNGIHKIHKIHKIHNPPSLLLRFSSAVSAKHGEQNMTKHITVTASLLLLLCFVSLSLVPIEKKKKD